MNDFDATEIAYKNGYLQALIDLREQLAKDIDTYDSICNKLLSDKSIEKTVKERTDE